MDLGLSGKKAIVCASSRGLGKAIAIELAKEGCVTAINGRDPKSLNLAASEIESATGYKPDVVVGDLSTQSGRTNLLSAIPEPDILITNNGGPPPGAIGEWTHENWLDALEANMLSAIHLIEEVIAGMQRRKFGRIVNITSAMVKSPKLPMALSTTARAGLTAFTRALAPEVIKCNVTVNNLLPEKIETDRLHQLINETSSRANISPGQAREKFLKTIPAGRFGKPEEFAAICIFLCSERAAYITGQNISVDGGSYRGFI